MGLGLYDFLIEHKISYEKLIDMLYEMRGFMWFDVENTVRGLDCEYNHKEFLALKKKLKEQKRG